MNTQRLIVGTVVGAIILFVLSYLIFDLALAGYYAAHASAIPGLFKQPELYWAFALASITEAVLLTLCLLWRPGSLTLGKGATTGAIVGFLVWFSADITYFGIADVWQLSIAIIDPFVEAIHFSITGAIVALVLAKLP